MGKSKNKTNGNNDGLQSKVAKVEFHSDKKGRFFYFCDAVKNMSFELNEKKYVYFCEYRMHQGLIEDTKVCKTRSCEMMKKLWLRDYSKNRKCNQLYKVYTSNLKKRYVNRR